MPSSYKRLGDYIQEVNIRNRDLNNIPLLGVSIKKVLMPSIANIIGTDMSTYKLIQKYQFAYGPVTSRNGDKISIALLEEYDNAMVSQAYTVFEVIDECKLLPEYLMMWFRRPEFDRYARFKSHGSAREIFDWGEMCETLLPIPSLEKQREIVKEYNTIQNRIALNNQLISKLEDTAQTIYKQWFVDFEFPNENSFPYKSNGGKMIWCEELDIEIPEGWDYLPIEDFSSDIISGKTPPTDDSENYGEYMPFITIPDMHNKIFTGSANRFLSLQGVDHQKNKTLPLNSICVSCIGTAGLVVITSELCQTNQQINSIICKKGVSVFYTFLTLKGLEQQINDWGNKGSVGVNMNKTEFSAMKIIKPSNDVMKLFDNILKFVFDNIMLNEKENQKLKDLKDLLLAKMTRVESGNELVK
jgi:type I restriction enzyme S subunit